MHLPSWISIHLFTFSIRIFLYYFIVIGFIWNPLRFPTLFVIPALSGFLFWMFAYRLSLSTRWSRLFFCLLLVLIFILLIIPILSLSLENLPIYNYGWIVSWYIFITGVILGSLIGTYWRFVLISRKNGNRNEATTMVLLVIFSITMIFGLSFLWKFTKESIHEKIITLWAIESYQKMENSYKEIEKNRFLDLTFSTRSGWTNDWVSLTQTFRSEDENLSIKFPDGKVQMNQMNLEDGGKIKFYIVDIGSDNSKNYTSYLVHDFVFQTPLQINEWLVHKVNSSITDVLIEMRNDSQIKDNMLLWELTVKRIPWKLQSYWFKQNILFNDTAYALEWILKTEGNSYHLINTAIFYPVATNPNAAEFFNSFQFHSMALKPTTSVKPSPWKLPASNLVITPKSKSSISGEVIIKKSSISGEVLIR